MHAGSIPACAWLETIQGWFLKTSSYQGLKKNDTSSIVFSAPMPKSPGGI